MTQEFTAEELAWGDAFEMPPKVNMFRGGNKDTFVKNGTQIFKLLEGAIQKYKPGVDISKLDVLDFGCGVGRVAMPFFHKYGRPTAAVDIQRFAVDFLSKTLPKVDVRKGAIQPPMDFPDGSFDVVYAISVWTHMNKGTGDMWLKEVARLLKPGGLALISTSSYYVLDLHRKHKVRAELWKDVSDAELKEKGFVFRSNDYAGIDEPYGEIVYDPEWLGKHWGSIIPHKEIRIRAVGGAFGGRQDLNIMQKAG
ncbi:MAG: class I SAM-dependent methyltransferase [Fuscovulum sp.]|jgi:SAM-dependent methyltransferase|nr:class I SAM-dependent methyltransferase [Fuscovulum sp.]